MVEALVVIYVKEMMTLKDFMIHLLVLDLTHLD